MLKPGSTVMTIDSIYHKSSEYWDLHEAILIFFQFDVPRLSSSVVTKNSTKENDNISTTEWILIRFVSK